MGFRKEYHVLDAINLPSCASFRSESVARAKRRLRGWMPLGQSAKNDIRHALLYSDVAEYYGYFSSLVDFEGIHLTGDITPSYAGLSPDVLRDVRAELINRGFDVRVVFLMRDPVKRCVSAMRMHRRKFAVTDPDENRTLRDLYASPDFEMRTRYDLTMQSMEAAFPQDEIMHLFYEELFSRNAIESVCRFLGLKFIEPDFDKKINVDQSKFKLSSELLDQVAEHYAPVYRSVIDSFGLERVGALWPRARAIGS